MVFVVMLCLRLGYVRNVMTNDHFRFVSSLQNRRWWTYLVALCIMVVFVSIVSIADDMPIDRMIFLDDQHFDASEIFPLSNLPFHRSVRYERQLTRSDQSTP